MYTLWVFSRLYKSKHLLTFLSCMEPKSKKRCLVAANVFIWIMLIPNGGVMAFLLLHFFLLDLCFFPYWWKSLPDSECSLTVIRIWLEQCPLWLLLRMLLLAYYTSLHVKAVATGLRTEPKIFDICFLFNNIAKLQNHQIIYNQVCTIFTILLLSS